MQSLSSFAVTLYKPCKIEQELLCSRPQFPAQAMGNMIYILQLLQSKMLEAFHHSFQYKKTLSSARF